jgi:hypothetical protein
VDQSPDQLGKLDLLRRSFPWRFTPSTDRPGRRERLPALDLRGAGN